jgi:hypothetical protein
LLHTWDDGVITKEPTEAEKGIKTYTCTKCDAQKQEEIAELSHVHTYEEGWTKVDETAHWHAPACSDTTEGSGKEAHTWNDGVVTKEPTETEKGVKTYTCSKCDAEKQEEIAELSHEHTYEEGWTKVDDTVHWHAPACSDITEGSGKEAHTWDNGTTVTSATTSKDGLIKYTCTGCGAEKEEVIPAAIKTADYVEMEAELSCLVTAMGGQQFANGLFEKASVAKMEDGTYYLKLELTKGLVNIYTVTCNTFVDVSEHLGGSPTYRGVKDGTLGIYKSDGTLVTDGIVYELSDEGDVCANPDYESDPTNGYSRYVKTIYFPLEELVLNQEIYLSICPDEVKAAIAFYCQDCKVRALGARGIIKSTGKLFTGSLSNFLSDYVRGENGKSRGDLSGKTLKCTCSEVISSANDIVWSINE